MDLYTQHFRGRVLTIVSDCSYSGSWVREAMAFMDEQGVGPCGHVAKEKGILVKVITSCLANEIPAELTFSIHGMINDTSKVPSYRGDELHNGQHTCGLDFTRLRCKNKIDQPCTMAPRSTWDQWRTAKTVLVVRGKDQGRPAWHYVKLKDSEGIHKEFRTAFATGYTDIALYGDILKSGWGKNPPDSVKKEIDELYPMVNYKFTR